MTQGTSITYTYAYNGDGTRLKQTVITPTSTVPTTYTVDLAGGLTQVLVDVTSGVTNTYLYGVSRIAQTKSSASGANYFLNDAAGSVRQLVDSNVLVILARSYDPYGNVLSSSGLGSTSYAFDGEWQDATSLLYLRARYYGPGMGRFLAKDMWPGSYANPLTFNGWAFARNNPINMFDPTGMIEMWQQYVPESSWSSGTSMSYSSSTSTTSSSTTSSSTSQVIPTDYSSWVPPEVTLYPPSPTSTSQPSTDSGVTGSVTNNTSTGVTPPAPVITQPPTQPPTCAVYVGTICMVVTPIPTQSGAPTPPAPTPTTTPLATPTGTANPWSTPAFATIPAPNTGTPTPSAPTPTASVITKPLSCPAFYVYNGMTCLAVTPIPTPSGTPTPQGPAPNLPSLLGGIGYSGGVPGVSMTGGLEGILMPDGTLATYSYMGQGTSSNSVGGGASGAFYGGLVFNLENPEDYASGPSNSFSGTLSYGEIGGTVSFFGELDDVWGFTVGYAPGAQASLGGSVTNSDMLWSTN